MRSKLVLTVAAGLLAGTIAATAQQSGGPAGDRDKSGQATDSGVTSTPFGMAWIRAGGRPQKRATSFAEVALTATCAATPRTRKRLPVRPDGDGAGPRTVHSRWVPESFCVLLGEIASARRRSRKLRRGDSPDVRRGCASSDLLAT